MVLSILKSGVVGLAAELHSLLVQVMSYWITLPDEIRAAMDISYIRYFDGYSCWDVVKSYRRNY